MVNSTVTHLFLFFLFRLRREGMSLGGGINSWSRNDAGCEFCTRANKHDRTSACTGACTSTSGASKTASESTHLTCTSTLLTGTSFPCLVYQFIQTRDYVQYKFCMSTYSTSFVRVRTEHQNASVVRLRKKMKVQNLNYSVAHTP